MAHHDTKSLHIEHIGLINNATGVATLLEVARLLNNFDSWFNIKFLFAGAEQHFRSGSRAYVSELSYTEKSNIIGIINVDMVGEKYAGDVVMQSFAGRHNIMSLMIGDKMNLIGEGFRSDDLSFHMGQLPVITLANIEPDFQISSADMHEELEYLDIEQLAYTVELIVNYLLNLCSITYYELLEDGVRHTSNLTTDRIGDINNFSMIEINDILVDNGYDSITEYSYEDSDGRRFVMTERNLLFMPNDLLDTAQCPVLYYPDDRWNFGRSWHYSITTQLDGFTEILYITDAYFGTISGDISVEEAIAIIEQYYENEYMLIWGGKPDYIRFCVH